MATRIAKGKSAPIPGTSSASFPPARSVPRTPAFPGRAPSSIQLRDTQGRFRGSISITWNGIDAVMRIPKRLQDDMVEAKDSVLEELQEEMVEWAKANAPWQDVTGDAREELHSPEIIELADGSSIIILAHGVSYGVELETKNGGAVGIIAKTLDHFAAEIPARMKQKVNKR